jgi:hypothetical protein
MGLFTAKYIKTKQYRIIVFSAAIEHIAFKNFEPISAGFISFGVDANQNPDCACYGESVSLDLKSDEEDSFFAKTQILDIRN